MPPLRLGWEEKKTIVNSMVWWSIYVLKWPHQSDTDPDRVSNFSRDDILSSDEKKEKKCSDG